VDDDVELLARLRSGDEQAFIILVRRHHTAMLRLAATFVPSFAVAEEVVQDTWLGVLRGISAFQGRSSVKTWLFRILVNRARTAGVRERPTVTLGEEPATSPRYSAHDRHRSRLASGHGRAPSGGELDRFSSVKSSGLAPGCLPGHAA
jgi:RNA polymerase sigma factor (sigma-70 family)